MRNFQNLILLSLFVVLFSCEKENIVQNEYSSIDLENNHVQIDNRSLTPCCPGCQISGTYSATEDGTVTIFSIDDCTSASFPVTAPSGTFSVTYQGRANGALRAVYHASSNFSGPECDISFSFNCGRSTSGSVILFNQNGVEFPFPDISKKIGDYTRCTPDTPTF